MRGRGELKLSILPEVNEDHTMKTLILIALVIFLKKMLYIFLLVITVINSVISVTLTAS